MKKIYPQWNKQFSKNINQGKLKYDWIYFFYLKKLINDVNILGTLNHSVFVFGAHELYK
jgi:hypothetical protein